MAEVFLHHPWLLACLLVAAVIVSCVALVFITEYLAKTRQSDNDAALKQDMLNRGLTAADIRTVLEANSSGSSNRRAEPVRFGLGKFQFEVGASKKA